MLSQKSGPDNFAPKYYIPWTEHENVHEERIPLTVLSSGKTPSTLDARLDDISLNVQSQQHTGSFDTHYSSCLFTDSNGRDYLTDGWRSDYGVNQKQSLLSTARTESSFIPPLQTGPLPLAPPPSYESVVIDLIPTPEETDQVAAVEKEVKIEKVAHRKSKSGGKYFQVFISFVSHVGCIIFLLLLVNEMLRSDDDVSKVAAFAACLGTLYFVILVESCCSNTCTYTHSNDNLAHLTSYIQKMQKARPKIVWSATGSYCETKTRTVLAAYPDGRVGQRTETYLGDPQEFKEKREFSFSRWHDTSDIDSILEEEEPVIYKFYKSFKFANDAVRKRYLDQKEHFRQEYLAKDKNMKFEEKFELDNFQGAMTISKDDESRPCLMHPCVFWLSVLLLLSWCYRLWYRTNKKCRYTFVKEIIA